MKNVDTHLIIKKESYFIPNLKRILDVIGLLFGWKEQIIGKIVDRIR